MVGITNNLELSVFNGISTGAAKKSPIPCPLLLGDELVNDSTENKSPDKMVATNNKNRNIMLRILKMFILYIYINI